MSLILYVLVGWILARTVVESLRTRGIGEIPLNRLVIFVFLWPIILAVVTWRGLRK